MASRACLHFFAGKAGAGKSSLARVLSAQHEAILISEDVWLARLYGDQMKTFDDYKALAPRLRAVVAPLVTDLLSLGNSVVLDFPANTRAGRSWYRSIYEGANSSHVLHLLEATDSVCLERIDRRNAQRPEGSHHLTEEQFLQISSFFEPPVHEEGFNVEVHASSEPRDDSIP